MLTVTKNCIEFGRYSAIKSKYTIRITIRFRNIAMLKILDYSYTSFTFYRLSFDPGFIAAFTLFVKNILRILVLLLSDLESKHILAAKIPSVFIYFWCFMKRNVEQIP